MPSADSQGVDVSVSTAEEAISAGPASIPGEAAAETVPPPEVLAAAAAIGAIDAGPAPAAPAAPGPPAFVGAAPPLAVAGDEPVPMSGGDRAAGPAPGGAYAGSPVIMEEGG